jgi:tetratricopeptide (TPR) repeat protein
MRPSIHLWATVWLAVLTIVAGCRSVPGPSGSNPAQGASVEDDSEEATERRIQAHAHYATATIHDLNDRTAEAVKEYQLAVLQDLGNEDLVLEITRRFLQLKQPEAALEILEKAAARRQASGLLFSRLALTCMMLGKTNEAIAASETAIKRAPGLLLGYQQLAQIKMRQGDYAAALKVIQRAAVQEFSEPMPCIELAELGLGFNQAPPAVRDAARVIAGDLLTRAAAMNSTNPLVMQRLADGFLFLGKADEASAIYARLLERFPQLPGLRDRLIDIYIRQEDAVKASEQLESVLKDNPTNVRAHYLLGSLALQANDMESARDHFKKVLILNPDFEQAYYDLAIALINVGNGDEDKEQRRKTLEEAVEVLNRARTTFKVGFNVELYSGLAYGRLEDFTRAVKHLESAEIIARATETNRLTHGFYFQLGAAYERNKQIAEAENYMRKCIEMAPDYALALNYLGYMWAERGEHLEEARELIDKALKAEPENASFLDSMAWVLYKLNQPEEALPYMIKAIELSDDPDAVLFDHIGDIYATLNQPDKAREAWTQSLEIESNEVIARKLRASQASSRPDE